MRPTRILTAAALTASGLVLSAGAATAQTTTPNPDLVSFPTGPSCAGGTFRGEVRAILNAKTLPVGSRGQIVVQLRWNKGGTAYEDTAVAGTQLVYPTAGPAANYPFSISTARVPSTAKNLIAYAIGQVSSSSGTTTTSETLQSRVLLASHCGAETAATTKVTDVSLTCSGDVLSGQADLVDPPTSGTVPGVVAVQSRAEGATTWALAAPAKQFVVGSTTTALPYEVSIAGKHAFEYRTRATVNNGAAVFSPIVSDTTCAPAEVVPEAPAAALIPLTLAATAGAVVAVRRRRSSTSANASA